MITAHATRWALVKHLNDIPDDEIAALNIPTGILGVSEWDDVMRPTGPGSISTRRLRPRVRRRRGRRSRGTGCRVADLKRRNVRWKDPVQRYKGLGEMDANQLAETTMDPRHRTLRRLTVDDAERATEMFELLMGNEVAPRKEFIVQSAYELDADKIDA